MILHDLHCSVDNPFSSYKLRARGYEWAVYCFSAAWSCLLMCLGGGHGIWGPGTAGWGGRMYDGNGPPLLPEAPAETDGGGGYARVVAVENRPSLRTRCAAVVRARGGGSRARRRVAAETNAAPSITLRPLRAPAVAAARYGLVWVQYSHHLVQWTLWASFSLMLGVTVTS